ncbi:MAG TPA: hypothetical protein PLG50_04485 [bacterium]|nr:hypothetical protein [bacterium]HQG44894.1 hypothetical protein [bacterium]HQI50064.1 hypothetical protein [bacterium]HQJ63704.1 hypothetical protein [bacterium]
MENITALAGKIALIFDYCSQLGVAMRNKLFLSGSIGVRMEWYANSSRDVGALSLRLTLLANYLFFKNIKPLFKGQQARYTL